MVSPLQKARLAPDSKKAKILAAARRLFGEYGFEATTTRMIAKEVGIDISTLYYHWGEKSDLYEAVITDINEEIQAQFNEIERQAQNKQPTQRLEIAIDITCDYLQRHPDVANLLLLAYFTKAKGSVSLDSRVGEHIANIAIAMGLAMDREHISVQSKARVMAVWNAVLNFMSGESFFRPILKVDREAYLGVVKETLKFILIPAFAQKRGDGQPYNG